MGNRDLAPMDEVPADVARTMGAIDIRLAPDGGFTMLESGVPTSGTVRFSGSKAYLKIERRFDRPIADLGEGALRRNIEIELVLRSDGTIRYTDPGAFDPKSVILKRKSQP